MGLSKGNVKGVSGRGRKKERGRRVWVCKGLETKELAWRLRGVEGKPSVWGEAHAI